MPRGLGLIQFLYCHVTANNPLGSVKCNGRTVFLLLSAFFLPRHLVERDPDDGRWCAAVWGPNRGGEQGRGCKKHPNQRPGGVFAGPSQGATPGWQEEHLLGSECPWAWQRLPLGILLVQRLRYCAYYQWLFKCKVFK